jgi:phage major head subunit gpT-like protein
MSLASLSVRTSDLLTEIKTDMSMAFLNAIKREVPDWTSKLATMVSSGGKSTKYPMMNMLTGLREWVGPRQFESFSSFAYEIENKTYEKSVAINVDDINDLQVDHYKAIAESIAEQVRIWPQKLLQNALIGGVSTNCWDGQFFFDTDHPVDLYDSSKGTYSNNFTSTALTADNLQTVITNMSTIKFRDDEVNAFGQSGKLLLVVPPQLTKTAKEIVNAGLTVGSNIAGGTNVMAGVAEVLTINRLGNTSLGGSATTWYLFDVGQPIKPLIWQLREAPHITTLMSETDPNVFLRNEYQWGVKARGAAGYGMPFLAARAIA